MSSKGKGYLQIPQHTNDTDLTSTCSHPKRNILRLITSNALATTCLASLLLNFICFFHSFLSLRLSSERDVSLYAEISRDTPTPYRDDSIFAPRNRTLSDAAWDAWVADPGIVALPHDWVKAKMLPSAQKWPWDGDKGVYLLNGFQNIHCLVRQELPERHASKLIQ